MITNHAEGTFVSLRYSLGGDHPSQTTHHALSPEGLGPKYKKGGISRTAPLPLARQLLSLPPILHILYPSTIRSCSKGSRGLSVPLRVTGIFTDTSISPSSWLRQCPDRYTIRAGRNLPDKEFRYRLPGLQSTPSPKISASLNLPAPGRCQTLYFAFQLRRVLCFC